MGKDVLSPISSLEPFAKRIKKNIDIKGTVMRAGKQETALYADVLLMIANPIVSFHNVLKEIKDFSAVLEFKVNHAECESLGLGIELEACSSFLFLQNTK